MGIAVDLTGFDYTKVFDKSRKAADTLSKGVQFLLKKNKVELIVGDAAFSGKNEVTLKDGKKITGKNIIIATGLAAPDHPGLRVRRAEGPLLDRRAHAEEAAEEGSHPRAPAPSAWSSLTCGTGSASRCTWWK